MTQRRISTLFKRRPLSDLSKLRVQAVHGRMSSSIGLTPKQQAILDSLVDDQVTLCGRTLTRSELLSIFSLQQFPKSRALCEALDIAI